MACAVDAHVTDLKGKTFVKVYRGTFKRWENSENQDCICFVLADNSFYRMYHEQDCCEVVKIEEIIGELNDLVGSEILEAEDISGSIIQPKREQYEDEIKYTFYKIGTIKGHVNIRWYGSSNGYYSIAVNWEYVKE